MKTQKQLFRELKAIDARIKQLNQRKDGAYEMFINDKGAALSRLQAEQDAEYEKRTKVVEQLRALGVS